jgi:hypothetical protein
MLNANNEQKSQGVKPLKGDVGPFRAQKPSNKQNVALPGAPATCHTCQTSPTWLPRALEVVQHHWWRPVHHGPRPICQGLIPTSHNLCHNVLMRASLFPSVHGLVTHLSCFCHPNVHLMGSSAPWRSELIISPCAPILWYLSAGHGPAHQRLRPPGAHQS